MTQTKSDYDAWLLQLIKESVDLDEIESAIRIYLQKPRQALRESNAPLWYSYHFKSKAAFEHYLAHGLILSLFQDAEHGIYDLSLFVKEV